MPVEPDVVNVEAGPVRLGVPRCPSDATFPHQWRETEVYVPSFRIGRFPVTVREYLTFADKSGYAVDDQLRTDPRFADPNAPAAYVSWIDAVRYTQWLCRETGKPYRLIRDAEYEKAARGGLEGKCFPWGDDDPHGRADFGNPDGSPKPVGSFAPNGLGLYDMTGSIYCWCEQCFDEVVSYDQARMCYEDTRLRDVRLNPICRGCSFKTQDKASLYCAYRHEDPMEGRYDCIGFRVAINL